MWDFGIRSWKTRLYGAQELTVDMQGLELGVEPMDY